MVREHAPETGEAFDEFVFFRQALLEVGVGMHVEFDGETGVENHFDCGVEVAEIFR